MDSYSHFPGFTLFQVKARIPSTLQPLDDEDEQRRAAVRRSREAESEKWESIRKEVDARRAQEQEMERNFVQQGSLAFSDTRSRSCFQELQLSTFLVV